MARARRITRDDARNVIIQPERRLVIINRDMAEQISKVIWEHEVACLQEVHGEGNVEVVDDPMRYDIMIADKAELEKAAEHDEKIADRIRKGEHVEQGEVITPFRFTLYPERPLRAGPEWDRLAGVYGMHPEKQLQVVEVCYPDERVLANEYGVIVDEVTGKAPSTKKPEAA